MSIRIALDNPPEFYTNLDVIRGQVLLNLSRHEHVGAIIVKLEGESKTALAIPTEHPGMGMTRDRGPHGDTLHENHKILYKVAQVFPDENTPMPASPCFLNPGQHRFPFQFKFPFNNACGNPEAMAKIGGVMNPGGFASGAGLFGLGGIRVMDGTRQLMYSHVTKTLPPSFTGFPGEAEIRYYVKVTIQRPGLFKENWRYEIGLKFLPIEPPRPPKTNQEAYARRPFTFHPRSPSPAPQPKKRSSFFSSKSSSAPQSPVNGAHNLAPPSADGTADSKQPQTATASAPSVEMCARLPHPAILTCNKPIPLRLLAKKLVASTAEVYLIAMQIDLIGKTTVRCQNLVNTEASRWVIMSRQGLSIPLSRPEDAVGTEIVVPDSLWSDMPLPNTVMPSFVTCNLSRDYQLEVKLGLAWGRPPAQSTPSVSFLGHRSRSKVDLSEIPQELHLPLHFSTIQVFSGMEPPPALVEAIRQGRGKTTTSRPPKQAQQPQPQTWPQTQTPALPPRPTQRPQQQASDALYPSQLQPGQEQAPYDDAPPTYEEAMAEEMTGPMIPPTARPAYSGVTNENSPSTLPEKN
ncbi:Arrestin-like N-terminal domain-containing protein [Madurella fahalii]|uniref:Arrestin-like N-terminal domain-containing protein n=1 Tax=Madurella fahalii TaxID=1157608 RepID=A0ABQ0GBS1_9PEZI